jgi:hypothetical protein
VGRRTRRTRGTGAAPPRVTTYHPAVRIRPPPSPVPSARETDEPPALPPRRRRAASSPHPATTGGTRMRSPRWQNGCAPEPARRAAGLALAAITRVLAGRPGFWSNTEMEPRRAAARILICIGSSAAAPPPFGSWSLPTGNLGLGGQPDIFLAKPMERGIGGARAGAGVSTCRQTADRGRHDRSPGRGGKGARRRPDAPAYTLPAMRFLLPFRRLERPRGREDPAVRRRRNALEAEFEALTDDEIRARIARSATSSAEIAAASEPSEDELDHPAGAPTRDRQGAPEARERADPGALDDALPEVFAAAREAMPADARDAPLRRPAHRRHRPPPGQDRRDEDGRGQDPRPDRWRPSSTA